MRKLFWALGYITGGVVLALALYGGLVWLGAQQGDLGEVMALF